MKQDESISLSLFTFRSHFAAIHRDCSPPGSARACRPDTPGILEKTTHARAPITVRSRSRDRFRASVRERKQSTCLISAYRKSAVLVRQMSGSLGLVIHFELSGGLFTCGLRFRKSPVVAAASLSTDS